MNIHYTDSQKHVSYQKLLEFGLIVHIQGQTEQDTEYNGIAEKAL